MAIATAPAAGQPLLSAPLPTLSDEQRALAGRAAARRLALMSDQQMLRLRYEEVMQWTNPPWDSFTKRINPRPETATPGRLAEPKIHVDQVSQVCMRWAVLELGAMPTIRAKPKFVPPPIPDRDPSREATARQLYNIDRAEAQLQSTQMENMIVEWAAEANLHRTLLWAAWAKRAFGVSVVRTGWDPVDNLPTAELLENPSQVYRGWTKRHGRRLLSWVSVAEEMSPEEANFRFGIAIPLMDNGEVAWGAWLGTPDSGSLEQRPEQMGESNRMIWVDEYWELVREAGKATTVINALIVGGRVVDGPHTYPWKRLPFRVIENEHIPTYMHGKSTAEPMIGLNAAYDDMLDRQHRVIEFESGPRYQGLNMYHSAEQVNVPDPFELIALREGEEIRQIDTRVDFFPTQLHANELTESMYKSTGLTPIAWGMSPSAQASGRALSAEWRAVELPLAYALVNWTPEVLDIVRDWFDFAEAYDPAIAKIVKGYRRLAVIWEPLDIRDATEKTLDVIQRLQANILDPEGAMEATGIENPDEVMARIKAYLTDPVYNPLRFQQFLVLKQLTVQIQMAELQLQAVQGQAQQMQEQGGAAQQGEQAAAQQAQGAGGPVGPAQNQPGMSPGGGGLPVETGILSRTPLEGGSGNQLTATIQPTTGIAPR